MCTTTSPLLLCTAHIAVSRAVWHIKTQAHIRIVTHFVLRFVTHCRYGLGPAIQFPDLTSSHIQLCPVQLSCRQLMPAGRGQNTNCVSGIQTLHEYSFCYERWLITLRQTIKTNILYTLQLLILLSLLSPV